MTVLKNVKMLHLRGGNSNSCEGVNQNYVPAYM